MCFVLLFTPEVGLVGGRYTPYSIMYMSREKFSEKNVLEVFFISCSILIQSENMHYTPFILSMTKVLYLFLAKWI